MEIRFDIPAPEKRGDKFKLSEIPKGGSKFYSEPDITAIQGSCSYRCKKYNEYYRTKSLFEGGKFGVRVWRVC